MPERRAVRALVVVCALAASAASSRVAWASLNDSASASGSFATDVLAPPTAPAAGAGSCSFGSSDRIVLTWTATTSTWATGYEIGRSLTNGGPYTVIGTVNGVATTTYDDGPLSFSTTYYYAIRSMRNAWRSTDATASRKTRSSFCV